MLFGTYLSAEKKHSENIVSGNTGSQVGYAWKHLSKFITVDQESIAWLQERKNRLMEGTPADAVRSIRNAVWEAGIHGVSFSTALKKQGWEIQDKQISKREKTFAISSLVDYEELMSNLQKIQSISKKNRQLYQEKSRSLVKNFQLPQTEKFFTEMRPEDVLCGMLMFPKIMPFLFLLSASAEAIRHISTPKTEEGLKIALNQVLEKRNTIVKETESLQRTVNQLLSAEKNALADNPELQPESQQEIN